MRMRALAVTSSLCFAVVVTGCGTDPDVGATAEPSPVSAPAGLDLTNVAFVDLTGESAPEIEALDNVFKAKFVEVTAGTKITFRNAGRNTHNVLPAVEGAFAPVEADDFEPTATTEITFDEPGDFVYYCSLHGTARKGMVGAVRVMK